MDLKRIKDSNYKSLFNPFLSKAAFNKLASKFREASKSDDWDFLEELIPDMEITASSFHISGVTIDKPYGEVSEWLSDFIATQVPQKYLTNVKLHVKDDEFRLGETLVDTTILYPWTDQFREPMYVKGDCETLLDSGCYGNFANKGEWFAIGSFGLFVAPTELELILHFNVNEFPTWAFSTAGVVLVDILINRLDIPKKNISVLSDSQKTCELKVKGLTKPKRVALYDYIHGDLEIEGEVLKYTLRS